MEQVKQLTVGELRRAISKLPDEVVMVIDSDGWYDNISEVIIPDSDGAYCCVTFVPSTMKAMNNEHGNWDVRQGAFGAIPATTNEGVSA